MTLLGQIVTGINDPQSAIERAADGLAQKAFGKIPSFSLNTLLYGARPWPYPELGYIVKFDSPSDFLQFHMNPSEYDEDYGVKYPEEAVPGRDNPLLQYGSGDRHIIRMTIMLNDWFNKLPVIKSTEESIQWIYKNRQGLD